MEGRVLCLIVWTLAVAVAGDVCTSQVQTRTVSFETQTLKFPNSSINYTSNADCAWLLQTNNYDQVVHVTFTYLDTESSIGCTYDYVELLDGSSNYSSRIAKVCGNTTRDFYSTGRYMYIKFHSNGSVTGRGFQLTYQAVNISIVPASTYISTVFDFDALCQVLTRTVRFDTQTLKYPACYINYTSNTDCAWLLQTNSNDQVLHVTFTFLDMESSSACTRDYVELLDGSNSYSRRIVKVCGQTTGDFYSTGQNMYIKFHSDWSKEGRGFQMTYQAVYSWNVPTNGACTSQVLIRTVSYNTQTLKYPASRNNYTSNAECAWLLQTNSYGQVVHVTFKYLDTETSTSCSFDYVELLDASTYASTVFDFDGACTSQVLIRTVSYNTQTLKYPASSNNYPSNADCAWLLQTNNYDQVVHVTFTYLDTESSSYCTYDYVELLDSSSSYSSRIAKVCGQTTGDFYSTGQYMYIKFHSDGSVTGRGFQLTYQAVYRGNLPTNGVCISQVLTRTVSFDTQTLKYPAFSTRYPSNADCAWLLQTNNYDQVVHVTFTYLDTESSSDCTLDYVELLDGSNSYSSSIAKVCGETTGDFYSTGQYMYIKFHSDGSVTGRGFQLTYQGVYSWNVPTTSTYAPAVFDFEYNSGLGAGAIVGVAVCSSLFFIGIVTVIIVIVKRQRLQQPTTTIPTSAANNQFHNYSYPPPSAPTVGPPAFTIDPPSAYNDLFPSWGAGYPVNGAHPVSTPLQQSVPAGVCPAVVHPPAASSTGAGAQDPDSVDQTSVAQVKEGHVNPSFTMELAQPSVLQHLV